MSADPKFIELQKKMKGVFKEGTIYYGFRCVFQTKSFLDKYGIDDTGAGMVRFFGSIFLGSVVMAIYVGFIRPNGLETTWAFFNLIFLQNLSAFIVGFYNTKINKLGHTDKTSDVITQKLINLDTQTKHRMKEFMLH